MPALRQDISALIVSFFRETCGEGPRQIYELSCGLRGAAVAKPALSPFLSAVVALLISGQRAAGLEIPSLGLVG